MQKVFTSTRAAASHEVCAKKFEVDNAQSVCPKFPRQLVSPSLRRCLHLHLKLTMHKVFAKVSTSTGFAASQEVSAAPLEVDNAQSFCKSLSRQLVSPSLRRFVHLLFENDNAQSFSVNWCSRVSGGVCTSIGS